MPSGDANLKGTRCQPPMYPASPPRRRAEATHQCNREAGLRWSNGRRRRAAARRTRGVASGCLWPGSGRDAGGPYAAMKRLIGSCGCPRAARGRFCTARAQRVHSVGTARAQRGHSACTAWAQRVHSACTARAQRGHSACTAWAQRVHSACTAWAQRGHSACTAWAQRPLVRQLSRDHPENHPPPGKHTSTKQNQQIHTAIWHFQCETWFVLTHYLRFGTE